MPRRSWRVGSWQTTLVCCKNGFFFWEKQPEMVWTALHLILQCRTLLFRGPENGRADEKEGRGAPEGDPADQGVKIVIDQLEMAINRKNNTICMRCEFLSAVARSSCICSPTLHFRLHKIQCRTVCIATMQPAPFVGTLEIVRVS